MENLENFIRCKRKWKRTQGFHGFSIINTKAMAEKWRKGNLGSRFLVFSWDSRLITLDTCHNNKVGVFFASHSKRWGQAPHTYSKFFFKNPRAWSLKLSSLLEAKGTSKHANDLLWQRRKLQGSKPRAFLILWVRNLGLSAPNQLTTQTKNPRLQAPWFLYFSRWNARLNTLHTCNKIEQ